MHRCHRHHAGFCGHGFMTVEEEVKMLERAKEHAESMLRNINERLEKLRA